MLTFVVGGDNIYKLSRGGAPKRALKREKLSTLQNRKNDLVKRIWGTKELQKNFRVGIDREALDVLKCSSRSGQKTQKNLWKSSKTGLTKFGRCAKLSKSPAKKATTNWTLKIEQHYAWKYVQHTKQALEIFWVSRIWKDVRINKSPFNASDLESLDDINLISWYTIN